MVVIVRAYLAGDQRVRYWPMSYSTLWARCYLEYLYTKENSECVYALARQLQRVVAQRYNALAAVTCKRRSYVVSHTLLKSEGMWPCSPANSLYVRYLVPSVGPCRDLGGPERTLHAYLQARAERRRPYMPRHGR